MNLKFSPKPVSLIVLCVISLTGCVSPTPTAATVPPQPGSPSAAAPIVTDTPTVPPPEATATYPPTKAPATPSATTFVSTTGTKAPLAITVTPSPTTAVAGPFGNLALPVELAGTKILPPLPAEELSVAKTRIEAAMREGGVSVDLYDTDLVVAFPQGAGIGQYQEFAVPVRQSFAQFPYGQPVMALWDVAGLNKNGPLVYEVSFDGKNALLQNKSKNISLTRQAYFADQKEIAKTSTALFAQGSCYICWNGDERAACLICFP